MLQPLCLFRFSFYRFTIRVFHFRRRLQRLPSHVALFAFQFLVIRFFFILRKYESLYQSFWRSLELSLHFLLHLTLYFTFLNTAQYELSCLWQNKHFLVFKHLVLFNKKWTWNCSWSWNNVHRLSNLKTTVKCKCVGLYKWNRDNFLFNMVVHTVLLNACSFSENKFKVKVFNCALIVLFFF